VEELKGFLEEYGLVWVGGPGQEAEAGQQEPGEGREALLQALPPGPEALQAPPGPLAQAQVQRPAEQRAASGSSSGGSGGGGGSAAAPAADGGAAAAAGRLPFDLEQLRQQLQELSERASEGGGRLVPLHGAPGSPGRPAGAYTLQQAPEVQLWVFADGLRLHRCPPQPYSSAAARAVISDVLEGYYPAALRDEFPDGVAIQLVDRAAEPMAAAAAAAAAARGPPGPLSRQQLLQRLPAAVIRNGRVVSVRAGVEEYLRGAAAGAGQREVLDGGGGGGGGGSDGAGAAEGGCEGGGGEGSGSEGGGAEGAARLQVKDEGGARTYVLAMRGSDTIGELRRRLDAHRAQAGGGGGGGGGAPAYEIRSAFPARLYADDGATLRQAGLVPSATLFLRAAPPLR
jgi:hypothetical protein